MTVLRNTAVLGAAALLAACGGGDPADSVQSTDGGTTSPTNDAATTSSAPATNESAPVDTGPPPTGSTEIDPPPTQASDAGTTDPPITSDDAATEVDDQGLALIARGLYSVPGANTHCEVTEQVGAHVFYAFPAEGGDLYALCLVDERGEGDALSDARLRLTDPNGNVRADVMVNELTSGTEFDAFMRQLDDGLIPARVVAPLELTYRDGRRAVHGARLSIDGRAEFSIPIFLPHDRPAGRWSLSLGGVSSEPTLIDAPCADSGADDVDDPLRVPANLQFLRDAVFDDTPVLPFPHCRVFPVVVGSTFEDARALIGAWADHLGFTVEYSTASESDPECGNNAIVQRSTPPPGRFFPFWVSNPERFVTLIPQKPCPDAEIDDTRPVDTASDNAEVVSTTTAADTTTSTSPATTTTILPPDDDSGSTSEPPIDTSTGD